MIYNDVMEDSILTPISAKDVMMFEEMPIILSVFHLGSVCRYKPDFFERLLDSKFGPVVISARTNLILRYLILFWSFMNQNHLIVKRR